MAKRKNILDVYRDFKKKNPDHLLAFGDAEFFTFYMADAHKVNQALPDMRVERRMNCDIMRVHALAFPQLASRLMASGVKFATVARKISADGNWAYSISGRSDDGEKAAMRGDQNA